MTRKNWVTILLSFIIALLYSLPWLTFGDNPRYAAMRLNETGVSLRVAYLFVTVFLTSAVFFQSNFILKKALAKNSQAIRIMLHSAMLVITILGCTGLLILIASVTFEVQAIKAYFVFYLIRNTFLAVIVGLLSYIIDLMEKLEKERME